MAIINCQKEKAMTPSFRVKNNALTKAYFEILIFLKTTVNEMNNSSEFRSIPNRLKSVISKFLVYAI